MAKMLLNKFETRLNVDSLADILTDFGVTCDRKRNGSIWVKYYEKSWKDYEDVQSTVERIFREYGNTRLNINYDFFNHSAYFTCDDGTTLSMFYPYHGERNWPVLIKPLWDRGYYVKIADSSISHCKFTLIFVRKRNDDDQISEFLPADPELAFKKYVERNSL